MEKRGIFVLGIFFILIFVLSSFIISAADNTTDNSSSSNNNLISTGGAVDGANVDKAYQCLNNLISGNNQISLQEAFFATLALGSKTELTKVIEDNKGTNCWPKSGCKIKETAQGLLAYKALGKDTGEIVNWLLSRNGSVSDLQWYLQIDISNHGSSSCDISYDGSKKGTISIRSDMTLSGGAGSCLTISSSGYWLRISNNCLNKEFEISCDQDFVTNLLYQKSAGQTVFVSSNTNSKSASGTTKEKVQASCFKTNNACDYEGSLWAAYALSKTANSVGDFAPYLVALADDNTKYFPSSLIYVVSGGQDQYNDIIQSQKQSRYWEMTATPNNKFFDTSLGMLSLASTSAQERENAKNYLLSIQTTKGCWNNDNIRDTAFLLYSGWPKESVVTSTSGDIALCSEASSDYACTGSSECVDGGGRVLYEFQCAGATDYCCNIKPQPKHCTTGRVCNNGETCSGTVEATLEGDCCNAACQPVTVSNTCESDNTKQCKISCDSNTEDEITSSSCGDNTRKCCAQRTVVQSGSSTWIWITLLIILIILVALAIVFRDKLRIWWFQFRGKAKTAPVTRSSNNGGMGAQMPPRFGPRFPPTFGNMGVRPASRPAARSPVQPQRQQPQKTGRDKEMEETFRKLKEMSD